MNTVIKKARFSALIPRHAIMRADGFKSYGMGEGHAIKGNIFILLKLYGVCLSEEPTGDTCQGDLSPCIKTA